MSGQAGSANIGGILLLALSMVFIAVGFIFLPTSTDAITDLLNYSYSSNASINASFFTGFTNIVGISPLLVLLGFITEGVISGMLGLKLMKSGGSADPRSLMLLGISLVFIAIGFITEPIALDGISNVLHGDGHGVSASFTGYTPILKMSPMLLHLGYMVGAVITGFFGIKGMRTSAAED